MVNASSVCVGDYVDGLGAIVNVRPFHTQVASQASGDLPPGTPYWQHVAEELNCCYKLVQNKVLLEGQYGKKCFYSDDLVNVAVPNVLKVAA
jgi:hypothetical protein